VIDENKKAKKDTTAITPKIGDMDKNDKKKKKGFFQKLFGKKDK